MSLNQNQFAQLPIQGQIDMVGLGSNVISAAVSNSASGALMPLVPGQAVIIANEAGPLPTVLPLAANSDITSGFVVYNLKDISYAADARLEIALGGSIMYMTSGAAISRWAQVEVVYNAAGGGNVITSAGTNPVVGFAFDKATASGQLIRVYIENAAEVATTIGSISGLQAALNALQAPVLPYEVETDITTAGSGTLTAAGLVGKYIKRTGPSAAFSDATDSAANIVAALNTYVASSSFETKIRNATAYPMTITAGSNVTLTGQVIVPPFSTATYLLTITDTTDVAMTHLQTATLESNTQQITTSLSTVGAGTITGAGIAGGTTLRTGSTTAFTDTTDTAANIIAAVINGFTTQSFEYTYVNNTVADATIAGGSSVTLTGITSVPAGTSARYLVTITGASTVSMVGILAGSGSVVAPIAVGASLTLTPAQSGATVLLDTAGGSVATLPAATGSGTRYRFVVKTTTTSAAHKILAASGSDYLNGLVIGENSNTCKAFASAASTNHSIQMPFTGTQPSGGFIGDYFEFVDIAANLWNVNGMYQAGTTPTTPFSSATS